MIWAIKIGGVEKWVDISGVEIKKPPVETAGL